jgi:hypothetical protein
MAPSPRATAETCRPNRISSDGDQGANCKPKTGGTSRVGLGEATVQGLVQRPPLSALDEADTTANDTGPSARCNG